MAEEKRQQDERAAATAGELDEITAELVEDLRQKRAGWAEIYTRIARVESGELWRAAGYSSLTKWIEDLARRAGCQVQYIWRVKKAGKFYSAYAAAEAAQGRQAAPIEECGLGDEMLADLDRVADGDAAKAARYMGMALDGSLTKAKVKDMARTAAAARRAAKAVGQHADAPATAADGQVAAATAADILLALDSPALFYTADERGARLAPWQRRGFKLMAEFPANTGTADRARRMDALAIGPRSGVDQYECTLDMVEIKVSKSDLEHDTKHLEYESFADRCWFAVPADLVERAGELAPDGWGVIKYNPDTGAACIERAAELRPGVMRAQTLATALLRMLPPMR